MASESGDIYYTNLECQKKNVNIVNILFKTIVQIINENFPLVIFGVILYYTLRLVYRSYWHPLVLKKEVTDIGFDHIPKGLERKRRVSKLMKTRSVGTNIPPPYPNGWFAIAESKDVKTGEAHTVAAFGQDLCVYRGEDKIARCVDAYCPHLGANLGVGGSVRGYCIECPFHKWRFSGDDGTCVHVPGLEQAPKGVAIKKWIAKEVNGSIWVWYDADNREPLWEPSVAPEYSTLGLRGVMQYEIGTHILEILENGADNAHFNSLHKMSAPKLAQKYPTLSKLFGEFSWTAEWSQDDHIARMHFTQVYRIFGISLLHGRIEANQIGPGDTRYTVHLALGPVFVLQTITPLSPYVQRITQRIYSPPSNALIASLYYLLAAPQFENDIAVWNNKKYIPSPPYVKLDKTLRMYRNWVKQFYTENSISFRDAIQNNFDW